MYLATADLSLSPTIIGVVSLAGFGSFCYVLARLYAREQRRAHYLAFLNNVSNTAISSEGAERMLVANAATEVP